MTPDPRKRYQRTMARDGGLRRISLWTAALAAGGVLGSGAVAAVAYAQSQTGSDGGVTTGGSGQAGDDGSSPVAPDPGQGASDPGQGSGQGGFNQPQQAPVPQQRRQPMGVSGGS
jgi:hypothetical protein